MVDQTAEFLPKPSAPTVLPERFQIGKIHPEFKLDDFSDLYREDVNVKGFLDKHIRKILSDNQKKIETKSREDLSHWVCVSGYLHGMEGLAEKIGKDAKKAYRNWGALEFSRRIDEALSDKPDLIIAPIRRARKEGDTSDEFEFWVLNLTPREIEAVKETFKDKVKGDIEGNPVEASVGISATTDPEIAAILSDVTKEGEPDDIMLSRLRRENLLHRLGNELEINGESLSANEREILKRAKALLEKDTERKWTVSAAKIEVEKEMKIEEKDAEIAKLHGQGEPERRPQSRFHTDISDYMSEGHSEHSARSMVAKDVLRGRKEDELKELADTDPLTGLPNRRAFEEKLREEWRLVIDRLGGSLTFLEIDIDHFKDINDRHGHDMGDEVIKIIAKVLEQSVRDVDFVARLGGEEFAILMPGKDKVDDEVKSQIIGRLVKAVETYAEYPQGLNPTVSIGAATYPNGDEIKDPEKLYKAADTALYDAKKGGRNRLVRFEDTNSPE